MSTSRASPAAAPLAARPRLPARLRAQTSGGAQPRRRGAAPGSASEDAAGGPTDQPGSESYADLAGRVSSSLDAAAALTSEVGALTNALLGGSPGRGRRRVRRLTRRRRGRR